MRDLSDWIIALGVALVGGGIVWVTFSGDPCDDRSIRRSVWTERCVGLDIPHCTVTPTDLSVLVHVKEVFPQCFNKQ